MLFSLEIKILLSLLLVFVFGKNWTAFSTIKSASDCTFSSPNCYQTILRDSLFDRIKNWLRLHVKDIKAEFSSAKFVCMVCFSPSRLISIHLEKEIFHWGVSVSMDVHVDYTNEERRSHHITCIPYKIFLSDFAFKHNLYSHLLSIHWASGMLFKWGFFKTYFYQFHLAPVQQKEFKAFSLASDVG